MDNVAKLQMVQIIQQYTLQKVSLKKKTATAYEKKMNV